ncbi:MAG: hypothetical protein IPN20_12515 [Haliscomenobacter sp.]|nr:hypothetical protein [Haliscomenobacter sp.]
MKYLWVCIALSIRHGHGFSPFVGRIRNPVLGIETGAFYPVQAYAGFIIDQIFINPVKEFLLVVV